MTAATGTTPAADERLAASPDRLRVSSTDALVLLAIWVVATACNLGKAVHVDDTAHLEIARHIVLDPLHPLSGSLFWSDTAEPIFCTNQPHLFFYLLAACLKCFGSGTLAPQLLVAAFTACAIVLFHGVARREAPRHATAVCALVFLGPAFLPAQNLMADVPLLTFALLALHALYEDAADRGRGLWLAAIATGLACLTKYTGLALLPMLVVAAARGPRRRLLALCVPLGMLLAWSVFNQLDYGAVHLFGRPTPPRSLGALAVRAFEWTSSLGSLAPFAVLLAPWLWRARLGAVLLALTLVSGAALAAVSMSVGQPVARALTNAAFAEIGVLVLGWIALDPPFASSYDQLVRRRLLLAWVLGLAGFIVVLSPFIAARHVLLFLPPVLLLVAQRPALLRPAPLVLACALSVLVGGALAIADRTWARTYATEAGRLRERFGRTSRIWTVGHWGWQWYAQEVGLTEYDVDRSTPRAGELFVIPRIVHKQRIDPAMRRRLELVGTDVYAADALTWMRPMSSESWGGVYESTLEMPSWSLSTAPLEHFDVYRVR